MNSAATPFLSLEALNRNYFKHILTRCDLQQYAAKPSGGKILTAVV